MTITVSSLKRTGRHFVERRFDGILSISRAGGDQHCCLPAAEEYERVCKLQFDDVTPAMIRPRRMLATQGHVQQILDFGHHFASGDILVHCAKGRSRSTAAAIILAFAGGKTPDAAAAWLFDKYPQSTPNGWLLLLTDIICGTERDGLYAATAARGFVKWDRRRPGQAASGFSTLHDGSFR